MVSPMRFWAKVRRLAGKVLFLDDMVAVWFCARDPATPVRVKAMLLGAIAYFVLPTDMVPDVLAGLGYGDDLAVLTAALRAVGAHVKDEHRDAARKVLASSDDSGLQSSKNKQ